MTMRGSALIELVYAMRQSYVIFSSSAKPPSTYVTTTAPVASRPVSKEMLASRRSRFVTRRTVLNWSHEATKPRSHEGKTGFLLRRRGLTPHLRGLVAPWLRGLVIRD